MAVSSQDLVEFLLFGPMNDRRQLQESPILGDVWVAYAIRPAARLDVLITPFRGSPTGKLAGYIARRAEVPAPTPDMDEDKDRHKHADVACLQGLVAARLYFREVLRLLVPLTKWWRERSDRELSEVFSTLRSKIRTVTEAVRKWAAANDEDEVAKAVEECSKLSAFERYASLAAVILWAGNNAKEGSTPRNALVDSLIDEQQPERVADAFDAMVQQIFQDFEKKETRTSRKKRTGDVEENENLDELRIWQISLNRRATQALEKSVPAVKADAARTLFKVKCDEIRWAILDSGIDGTHPAFNDSSGEPRIVETYDFSQIRKIISLDNLDPKGPTFAPRLNELLNPPILGDLQETSGKAAAAKRTQQATNILVELAKDAERERPIRWELVEKFIRIDAKNANAKPSSSHGTHVAGILGANGEAMKSGVAGSDATDGMCPDIKLYDFRVLAGTLDDTEFAIIAALQFIRYLNERHNYFSVHGANLSLSIPHDVRNFACGGTPICMECERLVANGVVVVAAAGNHGYQRYETRDGSYEGYTAFSITDPGNGDSVITVGATHRFWPHTYGVSFFSSRGPTGDGRLKPDIVAPGERIQSCLPGNGWGELDGTSMAAPHVSGAAAMLLARYSELIGRPREIKRVLCESATDLGRERTFQGHGMLDVLRAFQKM